MPVGLVQSGRGKRQKDKFEIRHLRLRYMTPILSEAGTE